MLASEVAGSQPATATVASSFTLTLNTSLQLQMQLNGYNELDEGEISFFSFLLPDKVKGRAKI